VEGPRSQVALPCVSAQHRPPLRSQACRPLPLLLELFRLDSLFASDAKQRKRNAKRRIGASSNLLACNNSSLLQHVVAPTSSVQAPLSSEVVRGCHQPPATVRRAPSFTHRVRSQLSTINSSTTSIHCAPITLRSIPNRTPPPPKWLLCTLSPAARSDRTSYVTPERLREKFDPPPQCHLQAWDTSRATQTLCAKLLQLLERP
jgi:hypothetical protein